MEPLLQQLERFSEVLSVSLTNHVSTWGPETVRRAFQWARYLRHVHRRFRSHGLAAVALLQPVEEELEASHPGISGEESQLLVGWLLEQSEVLAAFCRCLPAGLLTSVARRHPALCRAYLGLLTDWGEKLHYDLRKGTWVGAQSQDVPWEELLCKFQSLWHAPPPLKDQVLKALESSKARGGDFEARGLNFWTDLLLALRSGK
ncbi:Fanconi anemia group F protein [Fukomys damarensis]|uniref:Fanconi anemia group F protein n=1 Tax=Fukomys damarensis TaxID=885580 RepID=A0A091DVQ5_FUKDA|nr:Fanconi anemia group F protein [Fukomys damarensis]